MSETAPRPVPVAARLVAFRTVPARGAMALTLEVASADSPAAMSYLGWPVPGTAIHVALLRLAGSAAPQLGAPRDTEDVDPAPIHGTYEACRTVNGRSVLALTIDIPAERGHSAMQSLGVPVPGSDIQVAVVRLTGAPPPAKPPKPPGIAAVQRAALRPKDVPFQRFILGPFYVPGDATTNEQRAAAAIRKECGMDSRAELKTDPDKLARFITLERHYETWLQAGGAVPAEEAAR